MQPIGAPRRLGSGVLWDGAQVNEHIPDALRRPYESVPVNLHVSDRQTSKLRSYQTADPCRHVHHYPPFASRYVAPAAAKLSGPDKATFHPTYHHALSSTSRSVSYVNVENVV